MLYQVRAIIDGQPTFDVELPLILGELEVGGALEIHSPLEYHTARQRAWYKGICLAGMSQSTGYTPEECDYILKHQCHGHDLLKREVIYLGKMSSGAPALAERLTIVGVGKRNMTAFIENILSAAAEHPEWAITPPDEELRSK